MPVSALYFVGSSSHVESPQLQPLQTTQLHISPTLSPVKPDKSNPGSNNVSPTVAPLSANVQGPGRVVIPPLSLGPLVPQPQQEPQKPDRPKSAESKPLQVTQVPARRTDSPLSPPDDSRRTLVEPLAPGHPHPLQQQ